jgi:hypothetical protein
MQIYLYTHIHTRTYVLADFSHLEGEVLQNGESSKEKVILLNVTYKC